MNPPYFSIITPTVDRTDLLMRAIKSVLMQSFTDFEHIIVDDGNHPETEAVVGSFNDSRVYYIKNRNVRGAAAAFNTGIRAARGRLISFLGDDDEFLQGMLQKTYNLHQKWADHIRFSFTGILRVRQTKAGEQVILKHIWPEKFEDREQGLAVASGIGNGFGVFVRRTCFEQIGFYDEKLKYASDTEFMIRLAKNFEFRTVPEVLVKINMHSDQQLTDKKYGPVNWKGYYNTIHKHADFIFAHKKVMHAHAKAFTGISFKIKKKRSGRMMYLKLIRHYPFNWVFYADMLCYEMCGKHYKQWRNERRKRKLKRKG
ncbi:MAG: glycosyltransferase [Bacteroidales bacterium]